MSNKDLEATLRALPEVGTLVKDRGYRQVWRFVHEGKAYFLKFYPKGGPRDRFRRFFRGSPALKEFSRLQALQRAEIPAPRAVAAMMGFTILGRYGDAVILEAIEPSIQLDEVLNELQLRGESIPDHLQIAQQIRALVLKLGQAGLGHEDLHLGNFLLHDQKLHLLDGYAVRGGGMKMWDLQMLAHSVGQFATRTDLLRGWEQLGAGGAMPERNPVSDFLWKRFLQGITRENRYFGRIRFGNWRGVFYKRTKYGNRWSIASRMEIDRRDWAGALGKLFEELDCDQLEVIKRSRSGAVLGGKVVLAGRDLEVIIKRPRRRYWYRYINEIGRGSRARRAWKKSWNMLVRGIPAAWPLLMMERRRGGYVTDAIFVCERVPGNTLAHVDLDALGAEKRDTLLHRTGRILRQIEQYGFSHFDAKASNWMALQDDKRGPMPIVIDVDGIRRRRWVALGIQRLLRSMHENPHYRIEDSLSLCRGYAPFSRLAKEPVAEETKQPAEQI